VNIICCEVVLKTKIRAHKKWCEPGLTDFIKTVTAANHEDCVGRRGSNHSLLGVLHITRRRCWPWFRHFPLITLPSFEEWTTRDICTTILKLIHTLMTTDVFTITIRYQHSVQNLFKWYLSVTLCVSLSLLFSIVKIGLQQFSWTTDTWDIR
jgi:hypothetical protein